MQIHADENRQAWNRGDTMACSILLRRFIAVLMLIAFSWNGAAHAALSPEIQKGLAWLQARIQADGSLAGEAGSIATPLQNRSDSLHTLSLLATPPAGLAGILAADTEDNTEYLARKAIGLSFSGGNANQILAILSERQNSDGGFGGDEGYASEPLDTSWALMAMVQNGQVNSPSAISARAYLSISIGSDGGVAGVSDATRIHASALALLALQASQADLSIATIVKNLTSWLLQRQGADGGWLGEIYLSAQTYAALSPYLSDVAARSSATDFLVGKQAADGGWAQDPFLTAIALRALSSQSTLPQVLPGTLSGQVYDAGSGMALPGAVVTLNGPIGITQQSGTDGRFGFGNLAAGVYGLQISSPGYESHAATYTLNAGQAVDAGAIMLKPSPSTGIVRGQVVDGETGLALAGASVALSGGANLSTLTDAAGQFRLTGVPTGVVTLTASFAGYSAVSGSGNISAGQTLYFSPALFAAGAPGNTTTGQISGQVISLGSSTPLPNVQIEVNGVVATITGADGRFDISLAPGAYTLRFSLGGYSGATLSAQLTAGARQIANITLSPQLTASTIHGLVRDNGTGMPISGAQVQLVGGVAVTTGIDGGYALSDLNGLVFDLRVSATGYTSQAMQIQVGQPADITHDFTLSAQVGISLDMGALTASPSSAGRNADIGIAAVVSNNSGAAASAVPSMQVLNPQGAVIGNAVAYDATGTHMIGNFLLNAGQQLPILFRWNTGQFPPGTYTLIARLVEPGTIVSSNPNGQVLLERQASIAITGDGHFSGTVSANPPVVRAKADTAVQLSAVLRNDGNIVLEAQPYQLQIVNTKTNAIVSAQQVAGNAFAPGELQSLVFADWIPLDGADYNVIVSTTQASALGSISTVVHVGDAATAMFSVDKGTVPVGTQKVRGAIHVTGQDALVGTLSDPLLPLIKTAIQKGVNYNDPRASGDTLSWRCTACHVQSQALVGGELTKHLTTYNHNQRNVLFNALTLTQQSNGALDGYGGYQQTQTMLGLWALSSMENKAEIVSSLVKAADYLIGIQESSGSWSGDRYEAWWQGRASHTPFNVKSLIEVNRALVQAPPGSAGNYSLTAWRGGKNFSSNVSSVSDAAGNVYVSSYDGGGVWLVNPAGQVQTLMTGFNPYDLALASDGSLYVATSSGLKRRNLDGTVTTVTTDAGTGLAFGPDGNLYMSSYWKNQIYKITPQNTVTSHISGNGLSNPYGITFTTAGELLVANYGNHKILKYKSDGTYEEVIGWIGYPYYIKQTDSGFLVSTNSGLYRFNSDWQGERLLYGQTFGINVMPGDEILIGSGSSLVSLTKSPVDVITKKTKLDASIQKGVNWLMVDGNYDQNSNMTLAHRLIGLGNARSYYNDQAQANTIQAKMETINALLRTRQNADGGWGARAGSASDSMVTAQVGMALDYLNPVASDPAIRKAVQWLLSRQQGDGSWYSENSIMYTNLATTTWVVIWLPIALDRIGGIDTGLTVTTPANVALSNPSLAPSGTQSTADGSYTYQWNFSSVRTAGVDVAFDLTLKDMQPGESRAVATDAHLGFDNTFTQTPITLAIDVPKVAASAYLGLGVSTDRLSYGAHAPVDVGAVVSNTGATANSGSVNLSVYTSDGTLVSDLGTQPFTALASGAQQNINAEWNTGNYVVGNYAAIGTLYDTQNRKIAEATAPFLISTGITGPSAVSARLAVDKISYLPTDMVKLNDQIGNLTQNQLLDNLTAITTVYRPDGTTLWTQSGALGQIVPGGLKQLDYSVSLMLGTAGNYQAILSVQDVNGVEVARSETTFTVQATATTGSGLTGGLSATPKQIPMGDTLALAYSAANQGNSDLIAMPLTLSIVDPTAQSILASWDYTVDILQGKSSQGTQTWNGAGTRSGVGYVAVLSAVVGGKTLTLAQDSFTVIDPPVKLDVKQQLIRQGRVLVLLSCKNGEGDEHKEENKKEPASNAKPKTSDGKENDGGKESKDDDTCLASRVTYIGATLTGLGIEHLVTDSVEDFRAAFRSGQYNLYWISGGADKLKDRLAEEIREAAYRGDGLLLDGVHDERNKALDEVAGVLYRGKLGPVDQTVTFTGPLFPPGTLPSVGRPLRLALDGGTQQAGFPAGLKCDDCEDKADKNGATPGAPPAIVSHAYGHGHGLLFAFDLVGSLQSANAAPAWQDILRAALDALRPELPQIHTGGAYAVARTTIANLSNAVDLQIIDTLPQGASVIATTPAATLDSTGAQATWNFNLPVGQSQDLTLALRLPDPSGDATLTTQVNSVRNGQSKLYGSYPLTLNVASALDSAATAQLLADLKALSFGAGKDREARDQAVKALQDALDRTAQGDYDAAIDKLLDAIDKLQRINGKDMGAYRLGVDRWLQELELEWLLAQPLH